MAYNTKQKQLIYEFLKTNSDKCLTVSDISLYLANSDKRVGLTTIYRYLDELENNGIIRKYLADSKKGYNYQFVLSEDCSFHYHLKCLKCSKIIHAECLELGEINKHLYSSHNFYVDSAKTVIYGLCKECLDK